MLAFEFFGGKTQIGLQVTSSSYSITNNTAVTLTATATVGGIGYAGATINFYNQDFGTNYGTAVTNSSGIATKVITVNNSPAWNYTGDGRYFLSPMTFYVSFDGDLTYNPATSNTISININPLTLQLSSNIASTSAVRSGGSVLLTAKALAGTAGYAGATINFYNTDFTVNYGSAVTNTTGFATKTVTVNNNPTGTGDGFFSPMSFYSGFNGDTSYFSANSDVITINVDPNVTFYSFANTGLTAGVGAGGNITIPAGVRKISVLAIGAGGGSKGGDSLAWIKAGGGGGLAMVVDYPVTPGDTISWHAGISTVFNANTTAGATPGDSWVKDAAGNYIVWAQGGFAYTRAFLDDGFGDAFSANYILGPSAVLGGGGRGGIGGTNQTHSAPSGGATQYTFFGGGGGAAGGLNFNDFYTGTGRNANEGAYNGASYATWTVGDYVGSSYTVSGATAQPNGGEAIINWNSANTSMLNNTGTTNFGYWGGGWAVTANGAMTITATTKGAPGLGAGAGGPGQIWTSAQTAPIATYQGGRGLVQIMWGNNPAYHTFTY